MTKPSNIAGIEAATGRGWEQWVALLEASGARELTHRQIVAIVSSELNGAVDSADWWSQGITVAYEQHIGRRAPGQRNDGSYEVSVTKLIPGSKKNVFALWCEAYEHSTAFDGKPIENVRTSVTPVRLYWRCDFADGSRLAVAVEQRTPTKALISATHTKLSSDNDKNNWQRFWHDKLGKL